MRNFLFCLLLLVALGLSPVMAYAQEEAPDPSTTARIHFGPLALNPTIGISNVGIDTNVFNTWDDPKQDFTATVTPGTDLWLQAGRTRLSGRANVGYVYFQQYSQERSFNTDLSARYEVNLYHVRPYAIVSYLNTRERPGFEIDARARRFEHAYGFGADVPLTSRTTFGVEARRQATSYAADALFLGTYLRDVFDRREDTLQASVHYKLTPLTTFVVQASAERARFTYSPVRNSDAVRVMPGVEFNAFAIIQGSAYVGLRKLDMLGQGIPSYKGAVASVDLGYTLLGATRFAVQANRDVYYSFEVSWPYYVQTGFTASATQRIAGPFDAQARIGRQTLAYPLVGQSSFNVGRTDVVRFYGGGVGYRFGRSARLGFNVDSYQRTSPISTRTYKGLRIGSSLTYGF
jgi:hypothetical protein